MSKVIRRRALLRRAVAAAVFLAVALAVCGRALAVIDVSGYWTYRDEFWGEREIQIVQTGSALTLESPTVVPGYGDFPVMTGTIDTATGAFVVSAITCQDFSSKISGVATSDSFTMRGRATWSARPPNISACFDWEMDFTAKRARCGNAIVDPGETCDDGNPGGGYFDCCSSTCQLIGAGAVCRPAVRPCDVAETCNGTSPTCPVNQVAPAGTSCRASTGACDVGEVCDGSRLRCPPDAPPPALVKPRLGLASYDGVAGNDKLTFKAELPLSSAVAAFLDPVTTGIELAVGTTGEDGSLDVTLPAGAYDSVTRQGWKVAKSGRTWTFVGTNPLLPVTKAVIKLADGKAGPRAIIKLSGKKRSFAEAILAAPFSLRLALDPQFGTTESCGGTGFSIEGGLPPSCKVKAKGTALTCK